MNAPVSRRNLLAAAPFMGLAAAMTGATPVMGHTETPVMRKYAEWKRSHEAWIADMDRDGSDENNDRWCQATYALADEIVDIPCVGPMDFVFKLMGYTFDGAHEVGAGSKGEMIWAEARALVA